MMVAIVVLLVQTFVPQTISKLPLEATCAILAGSVLFLIWHVESTLLKSAANLEKMSSAVSLLSSTQAEFIDSTKVLNQTTLGTAFSEICGKTHRIGTLRIYAISAQQVLSFLKFFSVHIDECRILLRGFDPGECTNPDFANQIKLVVADWHRMQREGRISRLEIRHYNFHPTEYEVIFDRENLIQGLYDSDPEDYSGVTVRDPIIVRASSDGAKMVISEFADRFDKLFDICKDHHGPNEILL